MLIFCLCFESFFPFYPNKLSGLFEQQLILQQRDLHLTIETLFFGRSSEMADSILLIIFGYFKSQAILNLTALPLGLERFPSPIDTPVI